MIPAASRPVLVTTQRTAPTDLAAIKNKVVYLRDQG